MEKICKNCKWWDGPVSKSAVRPYDFGDCLLFEVVHEDDSNFGDNMIEFTEYLYIGQNFGCIHFEAKEPEYNIPS